ncbi:MAG: hypothetical protein HY332_04535 [Chloroflexi bacterium]|nr:hypothetical protein [Chloroflexota bacterium]
MSGSSTPRTVSSRRRTWPAVVLLVLLGIAVVVALNFATRVGRAFHQVQMARTLGGLPQGALEEIRPWMPLQVIARRTRTPEPMLEDALRRAGFAVQPQRTLPDVPDEVRPLAPLLDDAHEQVANRRPLLPPARQSLRQIAAFSGKDYAAAESAVKAAIRDFHDSLRPPPPPSPVRAPPPPREGSR